MSVERAAAGGGEVAERLRRAVADGRGLLAHDKVDEAIVLLEKARAIFPEYGGDDSPYALLATAYEKKGDERKQADVLQQVDDADRDERARRCSSSPTCSSRSATRRARRTRSTARCSSIRSMSAMHQRLATLATRGGRQADGGARAGGDRRARSGGRADALYQLALAQHDAGDDVHARTSVLRALEEAPNYEKAQTLLLHAVRRARDPAAGRRSHENSQTAIVAVACAMPRRRGVASAAAQRRRRRISAVLRQPGRVLPAAGVSRQSGVRRPVHVRAHQVSRATSTSAAKGRGGRTTIRAPKRIHEDPARHHRRASVRRAGADRRQRDRRARRSRCCSSIR